MNTRTGSAPTDYLKTFNGKQFKESLATYPGAVAGEQNRVLSP